MHEKLREMKCSERPQSRINADKLEATGSACKPPFSNPPTAIEAIDGEPSGQ